MISLVNFVFRSQSGTFVIKPHRTEPEKVELWIGEECSGAFDTPQDAAEDVRQRCAGFGLEAPLLSGWERFG